MHAGDIALVQFPFAELSAAKLRPVLLLKRLPGAYDDWLVCMISTVLKHAQSGIDEIVATNDADFAGSGLKTASVIRCTRLLVIDSALFPGALGSIDGDRLARVRFGLSNWILEE